MNQLMIDAAKDCFFKHFGEPKRILEAYAPGRVNIIGEHTDYNDLPVLPIATEQQIYIVAYPLKQSTICAINMDPKYSAREFELSSAIHSYPAGDWGNYLKAACQAIWLWCQKNAHQNLPLKGAQLCVAGDVPEGAGLSSSSATVVVMAVALARLNGLDISPEQLAGICAEGEQYVGTRGGGMDQAASLLSLQNHALCIHFNPLRTKPYQIPEDWRFVVAHSMVTAEKSGAARDAYNSRVAECRIGVRMFNQILRSQGNASVQYQSLGDLLRARADWPKLLAMLPDGPLSLQQCAVFAGMSAESLQEVIPEGSQTFQPKRRCRHVLTEGLRVRNACDAMAEGDIDTMGALMNASHRSCAEDYEISCPELDELVVLLRSFGAAGARLTGAGFGGCTVSLVAHEQADDLMAKLRTSFYKTLSDDEFKKRVFVTTASAGARVIQA